MKAHVKPHFKKTSKHDIYTQQCLITLSEKKTAEYVNKMYFKEPRLMTRLFT